MLSTLTLLKELQVHSCDGLKKRSHTIQHSSQSYMIEDRTHLPLNFYHWDLAVSLIGGDPHSLTLSELCPFLSKLPGELSLLYSGLLLIMFSS
jgi:hypothetical protein